MNHSSKNHGNGGDASLEPRKRHRSVGNASPNKPRNPRYVSNNRSRSGYKKVGARREFMFYDGLAGYKIGIAVALIVALTALGLGIAGIHKLRFNGWFSNNAVETTMLNVTGKANISDATLGVLRADLLCPDIFVHNQSGEISSEFNEQQILVPDQSGPTEDPPVPLPFESLTLGDLDTNVNVATSDGLFVRELEGPCQVVTYESEKWVSLGTPEPVFAPGFGVDDPGVSPPTNNEIVTTRVTLDSINLPAGAASVVVDFRILYSTEATYDFVEVFKNGDQIASFDGLGPSAMDPFLDATLTDQFVGDNDVYEFRYRKDTIWYAGFDYALFRAQNLRYFTAPPQAITLSFPANLTTMVGKTFDVCNADGLAHIIDISTADTQVAWDSDEYWPVIQFDDGSTGCCVQFKVPTEDSVLLISRGDQCSVFCASTDVLHCIDPERPEETNALHGLWRSLVKPSRLFWFGTPLVNFNMLRAPGQIELKYAGTSTFPREVTQEDSSPLAFNLYPASGLNGNTYTTDPLGRVSTPDTEAFNAFTVQSDGRLTQYITFDSTGTPLFPSMYFERYNVQDPIGNPEIIPYSTGTLDEKSPDDPAKMFTAAVDRFLYVGNSHIVKDLNSQTFIGVQEAYALRDRIIEEGVTYTRPVHKVFVTQSAEGWTTIRTDAYHYVMAASRVTISGCTGDWASMNGVHDVSTATIRGDVNPEAAFTDWGPDPDARTMHNQFAIFFNSTGFPSDSFGVGNLTGPCEMSVSYGPIKSDTQYRETISSVDYWIIETFKVAQHARTLIYYDPATEVGEGPAKAYIPYNTWDDLAAGLADGTALAINNRPTRANENNGYLYVGAAKRNFLDEVLNGDFFILPLDSRIGGTIDLNNRFQVRPDFDYYNPSGKYWYNIARQNYLIDVKVPIFRCVGPTTKPFFTNFAAGVIYNQEFTGCDFYEGDIVDYGTIPPAGDNFFGFNVEPNDGFFTSPYATRGSLWLDAASEQYHIGIINTTYTNDRRIGYIRIEDTSYSPSVWNQAGLFVPTGTPSGPRDEREHFVQMFSAWTRHLIVDQDVEDIIIDIRDNGGGVLHCITALRELFGNSTSEQWSASPFAARAQVSPDGPAYPTSNWELENDFLKMQDNIGVIYSSWSRELYPDAVFSNGDVIIITDTNAGSGGDLFPNAFLGENLDRDLGAGVTTKIIGDIDGRLSGASCAPQQIPTSRDSPSFVDQEGKPVSPLSNMRVDCGLVRIRGDGSLMHNRPSVLEIDCTPSLTGLAGNCPLPTDVETLVYPDLGLVTNTRPRLPGDTRPQTPVHADRFTWRDAWLEQAVEMALASPPAAKKRNISKKRAAPKRRHKRTTSETIELLSQAVGRDVTCPTGVEVTPWTNDVSKKSCYTVHDTKGLGSDDVHERQRMQMDDQQHISGMLLSEFKSGGLCADPTTAHWMVTPTCKRYPCFKSPMDERVLAHAQ